MAFHEIRFPANLSLGSSGGPERLTEISQQVKVERHPEGQWVINFGDEGDKFFIVREGQVLIILRPAQ